MQSKERNTQIERPSQIKIEVPVNSPVDFNSAAFIKQLNEVKVEIQSVLDGANIDTKKLSLHFTI